MKSIVYSVALRERGQELAMEEADRLVTPLQGLYGKSKRLLGFHAIKVWIQLAPDGPRLNIYLESTGSINETLEAGRHSQNPIDLELRRLFETITGSSWDDVVGQMVYSILDWQAEARPQVGASEEEGS